MGQPTGGRSCQDSGLAPLHASWTACGRYQWTGAWTAEAPNPRGALWAVPVDRGSGGANLMDGLRCSLAVCIREQATSRHVGGAVGALSK